MLRDRISQSKLIAEGWRVATVWECSLKLGDPTQVAQSLADWIDNRDSMTLNIEPEDLKG